MQTLCGSIVTAIQWGSLTSLNGLNMSSSISVNCRNSIDSRVVGVQLHSPLSMVLLTCIT